MTNKYEGKVVWITGKANCLDNGASLKGIYHNYSQGSFRLTTAAVSGRVVDSIFSKNEWTVSVSKVQ